MKQMTPRSSPKAPFGLFDTIAEDVLHFGTGSSFEAKKVPEILNLKREDVSRIASISVKSVRYDDAIPEQMKERLEEIANTINMVAKVFHGDIEKQAHGSKLKTLYWAMSLQGI